MIGFGQQTYVPDDNFEQALINLGYDNVLDDYVTTANINTVSYLWISSQNISDLTGIEDFTALTSLSCDDNQLTSLDVSNNTALTDLQCAFNQLTSLDLNGATALAYLDCYGNNLTSLDVSTNTALTFLSCDDNQLTSLDVSQNTVLRTLACNYNQLGSLDVNGAYALEYLVCGFNQLTSLDLSGNTVLKELRCGGNQLTSLDVSNNTALTSLYCSSLGIISTNFLTSLDLRNGNNTNMGQCTFAGNASLTCINVDDSTFSPGIAWVLDPQHYLSNNCPPPSSIQEHTTTKELLKVTDLLGRETKQTNQPLFYIYDDGTVEKRIVIE